MVVVTVSPKSTLPFQVCSMDSIAKLVCLLCNTALYNY